MKAKQAYPIHKFGGSSLADAKKFMAIKSLLKGRKEILVVSAVQGVTSSLQAMLDLAKNGFAYLDALNALEEKHLILISELSLNALSLNAENNDLRHVIQNDVLKIKDILYAVYLTRSYSIEIQGLILGYGVERRVN